MIHTKKMQNVEYQLKMIKLLGLEGGCCGLVVYPLAWRSGGPRFESRTHQFFFSISIKNFKIICEYIYAIASARGRFQGPLILDNGTLTQRSVNPKVGFATKTQKSVLQPKPKSRFSSILLIPT